jgi:hypothetical protein
MDARMNFSSEELEAVLLEIIGKWEQFNRLVQLKDGTPLAQKMRLFEPVCVEWFSQKHGLDKKNDDDIGLARVLIAMAIEAKAEYPRNDALDAAKEMGWAPQQKVTSSTSEVLRIVKTRLNTPIKRAGSLLLAVGLALSIIGAFQLPYYDPLNNWADAVFRQNPYRAAEYWLSAWGTYLTLTGFLFSFAYDYTFGKLVQWVKRG